MQPQPDHSDEEQIGQILNDFLDRKGRGEDVSAEQLLQDHPEFAAELQEHLEMLRELAPGDARDLPPASAIPGYRLVRLIHRGGQGTVYQAIQQSTGRTVAVKVMREGAFADARDRARFDREASILAAMSHPNLVGIIDRGTAATGSFYLVMEFVDGVPLDEYVLRLRQDPTVGPAGLARILELFTKIAEAVHTAHEQGVIHRDLKPANILVDERGEPHILDFGLARTPWTLMTDETQPQPVTITGQFIGSLPWASPEQAEGSSDQIDVRTDIYSLGVILYQMLTGQFPYEVVGTMRDVLDNIMKVAPTPPSRVLAKSQTKALAYWRRRWRRNTAVNPVIEAIVLKALAKSRDSRYQSAAEFAGDIAGYLAGQPTIAARGLRLMRKRRLVTMASCAAAVALTVGLGIGWLVRPDGLRATSGEVHLPITTALPDLQGADVWHWEATACRIYPDKGFLDFSVSKVNDTVLLTAAAESPEGWSVVQDVCLDSLVDFKGLESVRVEARISGRGRLAVLLTDGRPPAANGEPEALPLLFTAGWGSADPASIDGQKITIILSPPQYAAIVYVGDPPTLSQVVDIPQDMVRWRLRFQAQARRAGITPTTRPATETQPGADPAAPSRDHSELRVENVSVHRFGESLLAGRVLDERTHRPVEKATVRSAQGAQYCTGSNGLYVLKLDAADGNILIDVAAEGFEPVDPSTFVAPKPGGITRADLIMTRTLIRYGDALSCFDVPAAEPRSFVVSDGRLFFIAAQDRQVNAVQEGQACLYSADLTGMNPQRILATGDIDSLVCVNGAIYGASVWRSKLYRIDLATGVRVEREMPVCWPRALAFDGQRLWYLESCRPEHRHVLHAMEWPPGPVWRELSAITTSDTSVFGLAYGEGKLWVSGDEYVYELDPAKALVANDMNDAVTHRFPGHFQQLSFGEGTLWGLDKEAGKICRINLLEAAAQPATKPQQ